MVFTGVQLVATRGKPRLNWSEEYEKWGLAELGLKRSNKSGWKSDLVVVVLDCVLKFFPSVGSNPDYLNIGDHVMGDLI